MKINIELYCQSTAEHLTQIFTGFNILKERNFINLLIYKENNFQSGIMGKPVIRAIINQKFKLVYDTFDGNQLFDDDLAWCDFYFKRSFDTGKIAENGLTHKVFPLGFNYSVYSDKDNLVLQKLFWNIKNGITKSNLLPFIRSNLLLSFLLQTSNGKYTSRVSSFEAYPDVSFCPKILFITRLWETSGRRDAKDREDINIMRAECIRLLKNQFGDRFIGGLYPTLGALSQYPDITLREREIQKASYLRLLKTTQICVATRGLLGSNGWKIAEYIAGAKAIVSESLVYNVPGDFSPGKNYLEFASPQECVEKVQSLMDNIDLRYSIMKNNFDYYHAYLSPDILVWNTLQLALLKSWG